MVITTIQSQFKNKRGEIDMKTADEIVYANLDNYNGEQVLFPQTAIYCINEFHDQFKAQPIPVTEEKWLYTAKDISDMTDKEVAELLNRLQPQVTEGEELKWGMKSPITGRPMVQETVYDYEDPDNKGDSKAARIRWIDTDNGESFTDETQENINVYGLKVTRELQKLKQANDHMLIQHKENIQEEQKLRDRIAELKASHTGVVEALRKIVKTYLAEKSLSGFLIDDAISVIEKFEALHSLTSPQPKP